jgi:hypothetical protein
MEMTGWLFSENTWEESNSRLFTSKTNARIQNNVSAFFAVTTLFCEELKRVSLRERY